MWNLRIYIAVKGNGNFCFESLDCIGIIYLHQVLLEYQFTCHGKFKNAVNAIPCPELRLDPIGRDRAGRVYWLQLDHDANLRLYREDQDEETWDLIARYKLKLCLYSSCYCCIINAIKIV